MGKQKYVIGVAHSYGVTAHKKGLKCDPVMDDSFFNAVLNGVSEKAVIDRYCSEWREGWKHRKDNEGTYKKTGG